MEKRIKRLRNWISGLKTKLPIDREKASTLVVRKLEDSEFFLSAKSVLLFYGLDDEVDTRKIIRNACSKGKIVYLPRCNKKEELFTIGRVNSLEDLEKSSYGIMEPKQDVCKDYSGENIDLIILPGVVFDIKGNRIGRGKGYYDKFLKKIGKKTKRIGVAFDFQVLEDVSGREHDEPVDVVVSEKRIIHVKNK
ncbi:MAG: 5-formyltetrahydrofolate cyclo-ligase [Candidatus Auribacterota bacterium]|nr:5-formyltetrahydrofolate cyclo-ligase [Candidatus Auribacterota bacterium]